MGKHSKSEHAWARAKRERSEARTGASSTNPGRHAADGRAIAVGRVRQALGAHGEPKLAWDGTDHDQAAQDRPDSVDKRKAQAEAEALPRGRPW